LALGFLVPFGGRPAPAAEQCLGAVVELDSVCLGQGKQPAGQVDQVLGIGLLDILESCQVGTEVPDDVTLLGVLGFKPVNVLGLGSELAAEGVVVLSAGGQIST
jgi:hypothetical protein